MNKEELRELSQRLAGYQDENIAQVRIKLIEMSKLTEQPTVTNEDVNKYLVDQLEVLDNPTKYHYKDVEKCRTIVSSTRLAIKHFIDKLQAPQQSDNSEWISVEDRLPCTINEFNESETVLTFDREYNTVGMAYIDDGEWMNNENSQRLGNEIDITHWMPLPTKPKQ